MGRGGGCWLGFSPPVASHGGVEGRLGRPGESASRGQALLLDIVSGLHMSSPRPQLISISLAKKPHRALIYDHIL
jgi:hypothetical protein